MDESRKERGVKEASHKRIYFHLHEVQKQAKLINGVRSQDYYYLREKKVGVIR